MTGQGNSADCATVNSTEMQRGTYALALDSNKLTYLTSERCSDIAYGGKEETKTNNLKYKITN